MVLKIYSAADDPNLWKTLVAAKYVSVVVDRPAFTYGVDNKTNEFLEKSPLGQVPVLETDGGFLFEPNSIARYVAKMGRNILYGSTHFDAAAVDQWIEFAEKEIDLPAAVWIFPILGFIPNNPTAVAKAKTDIRKVLTVLNKHLGGRTFVVGERVTLADIILATSLYRLYTLVLDAPFRKAFGNANRWFQTVVNQPEFKAVVGNTNLCEKMMNAPASEETGTAPAAKEEKPKKEAKKEEKKKEEKPKEAKKPKKEDDDDDMDEEAHEEKKGPNPLYSLPPSKLIMDAWKRTYSNEDTRKVAIPWFWENYDPEGYSLWIGNYKYNNELEKLFMTCNLVGGFCQRLDKLRKYGFGSIIIFGQEPNLQIACCFLVRGKEIPAEMKECDDCENYDWRRVDTNDAASRELVNDFFAWDGSFTGYPPFNQGKIFK